MPHHMAGYHLSKEMEDCIQISGDCHDICEQTAQYCLQMGGQYVEASNVRLLLDCGEICQTNADFMLRNSDLYPETCQVCADTCDRCAQMCDRFGNDTQMKACGDICRRCATSCRQMAGVSVQRRAA